jgi:hypothetical protein
VNHFAGAMRKTAGLSHYPSEVSCLAVNKWPKVTILKTLAPYTKNTSQNSTSHISLSKVNALKGYRFTSSETKHPFDKLTIDARLRVRNKNKNNTKKTKS